MAFKYLILVIVLVNLCNGQYPNIVPGFNGGLDPSLIGYPPQFPSLNIGLDPSITGYPPQLPGQLSINPDHEISDVTSYANKDIEVIAARYFSPSARICICKINKQRRESGNKCCQKAGLGELVLCTSERRAVCNKLPDYDN